MRAACWRPLPSRVTVADGAVVLEGAVTSWAEHAERAEPVATVSAAPGVLVVDDRLPSLRRWSAYEVEPSRARAAATRGQHDR